jgi:hypothetical protein
MAWHKLNESIIVIKKCSYLFLCTFDQRKPFRCIRNETSLSRLFLDFAIYSHMYPYVVTQLKCARVPM